MAGGPGPSPFLKWQRHPNFLFGLKRKGKKKEDTKKGIRVPPTTSFHISISSDNLESQGFMGPWAAPRPPAIMSFSPQLYVRNITFTNKTQTGVHTVDDNV